MDIATRNALVEELSEAFGGAKDVTPADGQPAHILLTQLQLPSGWKPSPTPALVRFTTGWPNERPFFYIAADVVHSNGHPPRNQGGNLANLVQVLGQNWREFSFPFTWPNGRRAATRAVKLWLNRFALPG
jgi:hypothetical protein